MESPQRDHSTSTALGVDGTTPPPTRSPLPAGIATTPTQTKYTVADDEDDERRIQQRQKQVQYGYNTDGYQNMMRLLAAYPHLENGGVLPLNPPSTTLKTSKRTWDVLIRKWRRALHMFDHIFIEEEDKGTTTLEEVIEAQRQKWVSPSYSGTPKHGRAKFNAQQIMALRDSENVPKKLPVEENMVLILKSLDCYEPVSNVIPDAVPASRGGGLSPQSAGIKIFIAPTGAGGRCASPVRDAPSSPSATTPPTVARSPTQATSRTNPNSNVYKPAGGAARTASPQRQTSPMRFRGGSRFTVSSGDDPAMTPNTTFGATPPAYGCETPSTKLESRFMKVASTPPPPYNQSLGSNSSNRVK